MPALTAITAAVVGVILNLAIWFAIHSLFGEVRAIGGVDLPVLSSVNVPALMLSIAAMVAVFRFRVGMLPVLLVSALAGAA